VTVVLREQVRNITVSRPTATRPYPLELRLIISERETKNKKKGA
jgi:hypothetical protein